MSSDSFLLHVVKNDWAANYIQSEFLWKTNVRWKKEYMAKYI